MSSNINVSPSPLAGEGWGEGAQATTSEVDNIAIRVSNLSKCYPLYDSPRDRLKQFILPRLKRVVGKPPKNYFREFWALRNVSFEVAKGETLGIVGKNGTGKSTLLQILCGTLTPTEGHVDITGRVAALLELGAGFNPEFTGRENVYLNSSILELSRRETDEKFNDIVAFADIGDFIDQPVKVYSSGMFVRLAFAVQVCLDPEIMIVDEVLAVGDIFFRQKCYARLAELKKKGCSIVLVSHASNEIEEFCERALLLDDGVPVFLGNASEAIKRYYLVDQEKRGSQDVSFKTPSMQTTRTADRTPPENNFNWPEDRLFTDIRTLPQVTNGWAHCTRLLVCDSSGSPCYVFEQGQTAFFFYEFQALRPLRVPLAGIVLQNDKGTIVHGKGAMEYQTTLPDQMSPGERIRIAQTINLSLAMGDYTCEFGLATIDPAHYLNRSGMGHHELFSHIVRVCHIPHAAVISVIFRRRFARSQLTHHGVADLAGSLRCAIQ